MKASGMRDRAAIVGIGATEFSKDSRRSELSLAVECIKSALDDCGLAPTDIDGMCAYTMENNPDVSILRSLGGRELKWFSRVHYGGGAACGVVLQACAAIAAGIAEVVVVYRAMNERSFQRLGAGIQNQPALPTTESAHFSWYAPFGLLTPASWVAMCAQRYLYEHGASTETFGHVAVAGRRHAANNPAAWFYGRPITLADHQASRRVVDPLRLLDCCQESDGGVALVITSAERARDLKRKPAMIRAAAQGIAAGTDMMTPYYREPITALPEMELCARQLYATADIGPGDLDAGIIYDHFTPFVLVQLEEFGLCKRGEAKDFVAGGNIELGGGFPINTHGGQIGEAYIHGMNGIAEGVRLIRGTSVNQPTRAEHILVTAGTGVPTSAVILGQP